MWGTTPRITLWNTSESFPDDWRIENQNNGGTFLRFSRLNTDDPRGNGLIDIGSTGQIYIRGAGISEPPELNFRPNNGIAPDYLVWDWNIFNNQDRLELHSNPPQGTLNPFSFSDQKD